MRSYLRWLLGVATVLLVAAAPGRALDLLDDYDAGKPATGRWQLSLDVGWSIPLAKTVIPANRNTLASAAWMNLFITSDRKEMYPAQSTSLGGSVLYAFSPGFSAGVYGGTTLPFYANPSAADVNLQVALANPVTITQGTTVTRVLPVAKAGPWLGSGRFRFRPYVAGGAGWYNVNQYEQLNVLIPTTWSNGQQTVENFDGRYASRTDNYLGAMIGPGVAFSFEEHGSISLEGRYERVFSPGQKLHFLTPTLELTYHFG